MKIMKAWMSWSLVIIILVFTINYIHNMFVIKDPPGWKEHHERLKSGPSPEEIIIRQFNLDPRSQLDPEE